MTIYDRLPEGMTFDLETMSLKGTPTECGLFSFELPPFFLRHGMMLSTRIIRIEPKPAPYAFAGIPSGRQRRAPRGRRTERGQTGEQR